MAALISGFGLGFPGHPAQWRCLHELLPPLLNTAAVTDVDGSNVSDGSSDMDGDPGLVRTVAAVLLVVGGVGFAWYVRHAARAITLLRAARAQRDQARQDIDRFAARRLD